LSDPRDRLQFDTASGWFYDPITSYYYDQAKDQFYNGAKQQYLCWNKDKTCFEPAPVEATPETVTAAASDASNTAPAVPVDVGSTPAPTNLATELEQWQREQDKLGKKKKPAKMKGFAIKKVRVQNAVVKPSMLDDRLSLQKSTAGAGFKTVGDPSATPPPPESSDTTETEVSEAPAEADSLDFDAIVARLPPIPGSMHDFDNLQQRGFVDLDKFACLLCKRALGQLDKLEKHARISKLHIDNVDKHRSSILDNLTYDELSTPLFAGALLTLLALLLQGQGARKGGRGRDSLKLSRQVCAL
jgi:RNA-binding protein 5/10